MLTQYNSHTLNTHIGKAYPPAVFGGPKKQGFVDVLACHQTPEQNSWYRGSADAVRRNLGPILEQYRGVGIPDELLILSGQAVYRMVPPLPLPRSRLWSCFFVVCLCCFLKQGTEVPGVFLGILIFVRCTR